MTVRAAHLEAQAKINLFLRVRSREPNGYHQLQTLFQRISLADTVRVRTGVTGRSLECPGADVGPVEKNLAWRAALVFAGAAGWPEGFAIEIEKRIPVGGGLGGGSADAGAVLRILNALAPRPLGAVSLAEVAARLGADVPFLATEAALAVGLGRGERLTLLHALPARDLLLCLPTFGVSSAEAFEWYAATHGGTAAAPKAAVALPAQFDWETVARLAQNDLEEPVFAHHPELAVFRAAIERDGATIARMTGSGSTLFGVYPPGARPAITASCTVLAARTVERVAAVELV